MTRIQSFKPTFGVFCDRELLTVRFSPGGNFHTSGCDVTSGVFAGVSDLYLTEDLSLCLLFRRRESSSSDPLHLVRELTSGCVSKRFLTHVTVSLALCAAGTQCSALVPLYYQSAAIGCSAAGSDVRNCHLASLSCRKL